MIGGGDLKSNKGARRFGARIERTVKKKVTCHYIRRSLNEIKRVGLGESFAILGQKRGGRRELESLMGVAKI